MISLIKIVNTICFIIVLSNPVVYDTLFNSFRKIYSFLMHKLNISFHEYISVLYLILSICINMTSVTPIFACILHSNEIFRRHMNTHDIAILRKDVYVFYHQRRN